MGVQEHTIAHFKALINAKVDLEVQGRDTTFTFHHAHVKKAVLHHKMAIGPLLLLICVSLLLIKSAGFSQLKMNEINELTSLSLIATIF